MPPMRVTGSVRPRRAWAATALIATCAAVAPLDVHAQAARTHTDVIYATVDGKDLGLDLYLPAGVPAPALVVWVHGGAWRSGTKAKPPMVFVEGGMAMASLDFRQSGEARFPANVHDIKAAIRFLRAKAPQYGYRDGSHRDCRVVIGRASRGARRRVERPEGARRHGRRPSGPVVGRRGHHRLLRRLESDDHPRAVDAAWLERAPAGAASCCLAPSPTRSRASRSWPVRSRTSTAAIRRSSSFTAIRIRRCRSISRTSCRARTRGRASTSTSTSCMAPRTAGMPFFSPDRVARAMAFLRRTIGQ